MADTTPGGQPHCARCRRWYGPGEDHECDPAALDLTLYVDDGGLPIHLPIPVNAAGDGPLNDDEPHHRHMCWCNSPDCCWEKAFLRDHAKHQHSVRVAEQATSRLRTNRYRETARANRAEARQRAAEREAERLRMLLSEIQSILGDPDEARRLLKKGLA